MKQKNIKIQIEKLADEYCLLLNKKIKERKKEMKEDDRSHYLIYFLFGIDLKTGEKIDIYQNFGRFVYHYAGSFLEKAVFMCFKLRFPTAKKFKIQNTLSNKPKTFEIDCLINKNAYKIKWRDATTDGDHINKEHTRLKVIKEAGYKPVRMMFYSPNRKQAKNIQCKLKDMYRNMGGEFYEHEEAWNYLQRTTNINLKDILIQISKKNKNGMKHVNSR